MRLGFDEKNLVKSGSDDGDQLQRLGMYWFAVWFYNRYLMGFPEVMEKNMFRHFYNGLKFLENPNVRGKYLRSWNVGWVSDEDRISRDQMIPLLVSLGAYGMYRRLVDVFWDHLKRGLLFAYNTRKNGENQTKWKIPDLTGPEIWALYIRGFRSELFWPLLCVLDIETLIGSIWNRFSKDHDILNHTIVCIYGAEIMPTPTMWLANKINSSTQLNQKMESYFTTGDEFPLHEIYKEMIYKVIR